MRDCRDCGSREVVDWLTIQKERFRGRVRSHPDRLELRQDRIRERIGEMISRYKVSFKALLILVASVAALRGEEPPVSPANPLPVSEMPPMNAEDLAALTARVKKSVVVINVKGRTDSRFAIGSGFVIDPAGLIATNLHVIGESRPIEVQTADGRKLEVTHVHASDRHVDLAILRVNGQDLPALSLGDSDKLRQGEEVVALGNPLGLELSVVNGVVSALREVEGRPMIQVAMPIEQGNSGGPLVDRLGNVLGVITLKSLRAPNLGFAVTINQLKPMIERPNPIPMERWLTMEQVDPRDWTPLFGARWRQRGGRILTEGVGDGFGGRSLCLNGATFEKRPYDVAVEVKLGAEDGAAGLVFHANGEQLHYGFYPSGGRMRLSRFDGPDVFQWKVLEEVSSAAYRPGEWNHLLVRIKEGELECYVNHQLAIRSNDGTYRAGKVGLAKFRDTQAEFRRFQTGENLLTGSLEESVKNELNELLKPTDKPLLDEFQKNPRFAQPEGLEEIRAYALKLEQQAAGLRRITEELREERVRRELKEVVEGNADPFPLTKGALLIAQLDNEETDIEHSLRNLERMGEEIQKGLPENATADQRRETLHRFLFQEWGFHGSRHEYYVKENSYLDRVIDDREGIPITLAVVYLDLARRIGMQVEGIPLPGHFIASQKVPEKPTVYIDVFEQGKEMTEAEMKLRATSVTGIPPTEAQTSPATGREILERMVRNLFGLAQNEEDLEGMNRYVETLLAINPESADHHVKRALLRFQSRDYAGALGDVEWLQQSNSPEIDQDRVLQLRSLIERGLRAGME